MPSSLVDSTKKGQTLPLSFLGGRSEGTGSSPGSRQPHCLGQMAAM